MPNLPGKKKVAFGDDTLKGRLSCYSVISSLQVFDDISFIDQGVKILPLHIQYMVQIFAVCKLYIVSCI